MSGMRRDGRYELTATKAAWWLRHMMQSIVKMPLEETKRRLTAAGIAFEDYGSFLIIATNEDGVYRLLRREVISTRRDR